MDHQQVTLDKPSIVPRSEVPVAGTSSGDDLELRPFEAHEILRAATPASVTMAWSSAREGQDIAPRSHPRPCLLIVLHGSAELTGSVGQHVEQGDVVTLPAGHEYGFVKIGSSGIRALQVTFREDETQSREVVTLEQLLAYNELRASRTLHGPFFQLLEERGLASPERRARLRDAIRVFSDAFQNVLFIRQGTCRDETYSSVFHEHLAEELGHNTLLTVPELRQAPTDPILRATANWFCHQMLILDNIGKGALVHLVMETAGYHFHTLAAPLLSSDVAAEYFHVHAEADDDHRKVVLRFLADKHPNTYRRLHRIIECGWNVFDAMASRFVYLVESGDAGRDRVALPAPTRNVLEART